MSLRHTPEPWRLSEQEGDGQPYIVAEGALIARVLQHRVGSADRVEAHETQDANARRIVAAVNACAGIPTEALERVNFHGRARLIQLQRIIEDELDKPENAP